MADRKPILIVDDDTDLCNMIIEMVFNAGYGPTGVTNAREATFKLKNQKFACIVLDIRLGEETGEGVIEFVRKNVQSPNAQTPIIVISGFLDRELVENIAPHVQGALVKPFEPPTLLGLLKKLVG